jgi:transposase InsO family protein
MSCIHLQIKTHLFSESHRPTQARCQVKNIHFGNNRLLLKVGGTLSHCGNNDSRNSVENLPTVVVHTDRGTAFHNEIIEELLRMTGVEQSLTTAYSSEENGIVKRADQEVFGAPQRFLIGLLHDAILLT